MSETVQLFNEVFSKVTTEVEYDAAWENGTGYLNYAVCGRSAPILSEGMIAKTVDPAGRKILIVGTRLGNVVLFERYVNLSAEDMVYVVNAPSELKDFICSGRVYYETMAMLLGSGYNPNKDNIGKKLSKLFSYWVEAGSVN